jgi:hypothetical protein
MDEAVVTDMARLLGLVSVWHGTRNERRSHTLLWNGRRLLIAMALSESLRFSCTGKKP